MRFFFLLWALALLAVGSAPGASDVERPARLRVAVVAYEDFEQASGQYEQLLADLTAEDPELRFELAVGTYGDVRYWMEKEMVDVAIVTPSIFADALDPDLAVGSSKYRYLVTEELPRAVTPWAAAADRREGAFHGWYRSICVVSESSGLHSAGDLRRAAAQGRVRFVFVHPWSASGYCVPRMALEDLNIRPDRDESIFTFSHTASLRAVRDVGPVAVEKVAFVWDDVLRAAPQLGEGLRSLDLAPLDRRLIPADAVLVHEDLASAEALKQLLLDHHDPHGERRFSDLTGEQQRAAEMRDWTRSTSRGDLASSQALTLADIGRRLLHHGRTHGQPPRVAVVLPGGGAKCSYQVGAVAAVEEMFAELRRQEPQAGVDIGLVVGTSGGAINALPVALGITRTSEGSRAFRDVWIGLDQRDIVRPAPLVCANIGIWLMLVQVGCTMWLIRRFVGGPRRQFRCSVLLLVSLALLQLLVAYLQPPWHLLGGNHLIHHTWLWISFGLPTAAWSLLAVAVALVVVRWRWRSDEQPARAIAFRKTWRILAVGLLVLPLVQVITVLRFQHTLSRGDGVVHALATKFPRLLSEHLESERQERLTLPDDLADGERMRATSRRIIDDSVDRTNAG